MRLRLRLRDPARPRGPLRGRLRDSKAVPRLPPRALPDYGTYRGKPRAREDASSLPGFTPASELPLPRPPSPSKPPSAPRPTIGVPHEEADATPSPEAGRGWAFSQLVFNPGSFESVRAGFASYAREGETERDLRARVHSTVLADVEQQVMALWALHAKLRDLDAGESFGGVVAQARPTESQ